MNDTSQLDTVTAARLNAEVKSAYKWLAIEVNRSLVYVPDEYRPMAVQRQSLSVN